jgi:excinuclease ABC subunit C
VFPTEEGGVFEGFGPSAYYSARRQLVSWPLPKDGKERRRLIRTSAPARPGVYGMIDADGELIYVGKSKSLAKRLMSYFPASGRGEKAERIGRRAKRLVWETAPHEFLALLRELELIRRFSPRFNVQGQPERQRPGFIYLAAGPAPFFRVAAQPPSGCVHWFGPLQGVGRFTAAVEQLNRRFLLRDCSTKTPMRFAEQRELFTSERKAGCLRYELETCLGPCAALCTAQQYTHSVERALAFLRGEDRTTLDTLEQAMREAAKNCQFERAAALRVAWRSLLLIYRSLERLRDLRRNFSFVYDLRCRQRQRAWIFIRAGHAIAARAKPCGARAARAAAQQLNAVYSPAVEVPTPNDLDMLRLVGGWFHRREEEIRATHTLEEALRLCEKLQTITSQRTPRRATA